jgi:Family of unknown function (DUF6011)
MRCGKNHEHPSVSEVRDCYAQRDGGTYFRQADQAAETSAIQTAEREEAERAYAAKARRDEQRYPANHGTGTRYAGNPDRRHPGCHSHVAPGGYALPSRTGHNDLDFYWVDIPTEGKWTDWAFVRRIIGGHSPIEMRKAEQIMILSTLQATPSENPGRQARYGIKLGQCAKCGRTLTDETSRQLGIGPVCRNK